MGCTIFLEPQVIKRCRVLHKNSVSPDTGVGTSSSIAKRTRGHMSAGSSRRNGRKPLNRRTINAQGEGDRSFSRTSSARFTALPRFLHRITGRS